MESAALSTRLRYLNDSAHLLATTAPATSRHLVSRCSALIFEHELDLSEAQRRKACRACGTIMILGWEGTLQTEARPSSRRRKTPRDDQDMKQTKALVYKCETCGRKTRFPLCAPPQNSKQKPGLSDSRSMSTSQALTKPSPGSSVSEAKSSRKKRAKARKQDGLKALLDAKKSGPEASGFGLDLMDFMKKS
jgi:RNase P subunit RPR2